MLWNFEIHTSIIVLTFVPHIFKIAMVNTRTRTHTYDVEQKTKVYLNIYDLSPANDYLYPVGFGLHHTGVEIMGVEYSFGSGSGIFEMPPKTAPNAKFRTQLELGSYDGGSKELNMALDDMRHGSGKFGPDDYNLIKNNCNHFANGLVWRLLHKQIPPYINRLADVGNCCSCLLPRQLLQQDAPVGGSGGSSGGSGFMTSGGGGRIPNSSSMQRGNNMSSTAFSGKGQSLGGGGSGSDSGSGLFSRLTGSTSSSSSGVGGGHTSSEDGLKDRREKARMAALARLERNQQQNTDETKNQ